MNDTSNKSWGRSDRLSVVQIVVAVVFGVLSLIVAVGAIIVTIKLANPSNSPKHSVSSAEADTEKNSPHVSKAPRSGVQVVGAQSNPEQKGVIPLPAVRPVAADGDAGLVAQSDVTPLASSSAPIGLASAKSMGVSATVTRATSANGFVTVEVLLKNTNDQRIFLQNASYDAGEAASLGSGDTSDEPEFGGLNNCTQNFDYCSTYRGARTNFTPVDPGQTVVVHAKFHYWNKIPDDNTVSFSLVMLASLADRAMGGSGGLIPKADIDQVHLSFADVRLLSGKL